MTSGPTHCIATDARTLCGRFVSAVAGRYVPLFEFAAAIRSRLPGLCPRCRAIVLRQSAYNDLFSRRDRMPGPDATP